MNMFFTICFLSIVLFLGSCRRECPKTLTERYMGLMCLYDKSHHTLNELECDTERSKLQKKINRIHDQLEKLNAKILAKYQGCEKSMEIVREVTANHECE